MSVYIGPVGGLVKLDAAASLNTETTREQTVKVTTGGRRVAFQAPRAHRSWTLDTSVADPATLSKINSLELGLYGPPPWHWVDPLAQVSNVLTPGLSVFQEPTWGGGGPVVSTAPINLGNGLVVRRSLLIPDPTQFTAINGRPGNVYARTPVVPGKPITVSLYGFPSEAGGWMRVDYRDEADTSLGSAHAYATAAPGALERLTLTATPPAGAASIRILSYRLARVACPQVTWTPQVQPWASGHGAEKVILDGHSLTPTLLVPDAPRMQHGTASMQIVEVG